MDLTAFLVAVGITFSALTAVYASVVYSRAKAHSELIAAQSSDPTDGTEGASASKDRASELVGIYSED